MPVASARCMRASYTARSSSAAAAVFGTNAKAPCPRASPWTPAGACALVPPARTVAVQPLPASLSLSALVPACTVVTLRRLKLDGNSLGYLSGGYFVEAMDALLARLPAIEALHLGNNQLVRRRPRGRRKGGCVRR